MPQAIAALIIHLEDSEPDEGTTVMMTSSNGNIFRVTGLLCGEFTGPQAWVAWTPNFLEPQICAGRFNDVIWLRLDAKIVDKHKALQTAA